MRAKDNEILRTPDGRSCYQRNNNVNSNEGVNHADMISQAKLTVEQVSARKVGRRQRLIMLMSEIPREPYRAAKARQAGLALSGDNAIGQPGYRAVTRVAVTFGVYNVCASLVVSPCHHRDFGDGGTWAGLSGR